MKTLLVEDHVDNRRNLQRLIERRGHEVFAVASAEEGALALARERFDLLVLDWRLPGKSGLQLCRETRELTGGDEVFILLVTGRADAGDLQRALEAGANDYLVAPLDLGLFDVRLAFAERQIRDLTERNHARLAAQDSTRSLESILENMTDGFISLDADWRFIHVNPRAEEQLGQSRENLEGAQLWERYPQLLGSPFESNLRLVKSERSSLDFEAMGLDGKRWYEVHSFPSDGGGLSVFFRDITERKRAEDERLTTSKLESLGTLAGGIAHDLNNILTVISGNIGLAQMEAPREGGDELVSFLTKAGQAAEHAAHLSSQLLTFSKGGTPLMKPASVAELLAQAAEFSLYGSNLRLDLDIEKDLWHAEVDAGQIEQVVNGLVLNAREAMPQGGVVRLSARNVEFSPETNAFLPAGAYLKITVADRGGGISEEVATKIFDPYFTTKSSSSGLGLSISYSIVRKHGGLLHLEQTSPKGSTFAFYLRATPKVLVTPEKKIDERTDVFAHQRILVMDDEAAIRELTSQLLGTLGYEVTAVPDGEEAIKTYERAMERSEAFQAVILDATIRGGLGGLATIEQLRGLDPGVNALICSGYSDEAALAEFLAYGFRGALPKPFTRGQLADALQRTLQGGRAAELCA